MDPGITSPDNGLPLAVPGDRVVVSVIVPAFNPGDLILEAIDSVIGQTLAGVELIVINNGSTDGLSKRLERYRDRIRVIEFPENRRPAAARNAGIRQARGEYIALLDADDVWMPARLERVVGYMQAHPDIAIATTDAYMIFDGTKTRRSWFSTPGTIFFEDDQQTHIFQENFLSNLLVFRRELFERYGLFDEELWCEDWERNIEFISAGEKAGIVREPLAYYRVTPGSLGQTASLMQRDRKLILQRWLQRDLPPRVRRVAEDALRRAEWDYLKTHLLEGDREQATAARRELQRLVVSGPVDIKIKALAWRILPVKVVGRIHRWRRTLMASRGGAWAFEEAALALSRGDEAKARWHLDAVIVFGYPARTRLLAVLWRLLPPVRKIIASRLLSDPLAKVLAPEASGSDPILRDRGHL